MQTSSTFSRHRCCCSNVNLWHQCWSLANPTVLFATKFVFAVIIIYAVKTLIAKHLHMQQTAVVICSASVGLVINAVESVNLARKHWKQVFNRMIYYLDSEISKWVKA